MSGGNVTVGVIHRERTVHVFGWLCCDWQQGSLSQTDRLGGLHGAEGCAERSLSGPHGKGINIEWGSSFLCL